MIIHLLGPLEQPGAFIRKEADVGIVEMPGSSFRNGPFSGEYPQVFGLDIADERVVTGNTTIQ